MKSRTKESREPRQGPIPFALHLGYAGLVWMTSRSASALSKNDWTGWRPPYLHQVQPDPFHQAPHERAQAQDPERCAAALDREIAKRAGKFLGAVESYRNHPYRRSLARPDVLYSEGTTKLWHYRRDGRRRQRTPLLVIPSLINRAYILDLRKGQSFARWFAGKGHDVFLVDWQAPGAEERSFSLSDYVAGRLERALDALRSKLSRPPVALGYCMGGLLATALARRRESDFAGLALLATPWDFHNGSDERARLVAASHTAFLPYLINRGELPTEAIQALFSSLDPLLVYRKYLRFADLDPESHQARAFVSLEDWLNDGVPLAARVASECLLDWYGGNRPMKGTWKVAGEAVLPQELSLPSLCVIASNDRIVPPGSSLALARLFENGAILRPRVGHIGMMASGRAETEVWQPLADWLASLG